MVLIMKINQNGNTTSSENWCEGSSPSPSAKILKKQNKELYLQHGKVITRSKLNRRS